MGNWMTLMGCVCNIWNLIFFHVSRFRQLSSCSCSFCCSSLGFCSINLEKATQPINQSPHLFILKAGNCDGMLVDSLGIFPCNMFFSKEMSWFPRRILAKFTSDAGLKRWECYKGVPVFQDETLRWSTVQPIKFPHRLTWLNGSRGPWDSCNLIQLLNSGCLLVAY